MTFARFVPSAVSLRRGVLLPAAAVLVGGLLQVAAAQSYGIRPDGRLGIGVPVETKTINGTVTEVSPRGMAIESDGRAMPVPMNRSTDVRVEGRGDSGFLQPGAIVETWGTMQPDGSLVRAGLRVHVLPKTTAASGRRQTFNADDPQVNFFGRVLSTEPLVIQSLDTLVPTQPNPQGGPPREGKGVANPQVPVTLDDRNPETVPIVLGGDASMAAVGDTVAVMVRADNPNVASRVTIRKTEVAKSPATLAAEQGEQTSDDTKTSEGTDGKAEGGAAMQEKKPATRGRTPRSRRTRKSAPESGAAADGEANPLDGAAPSPEAAATVESD